MHPLLRPRVLIPFVVLVLVAGFQAIRIARVAELTALPQWSVDSPVRDGTSATGYRDQVRAVIARDPLGQSQQWIAQTQQTLNEGKWRIERVDYDNAPFGRPTDLPLPYRLWLGGLSWVHSTISGASDGVAVERVALYADPLLHLLLVVSATWFAARRFGSVAAALVAVASLTIYPLAASFWPGAPHPQGLLELCGVWSVLPLAAALLPRAAAKKYVSDRALFAVAGVAGGFGLWLGASEQMSVVAGIVLGAGLWIWFSRAEQRESAPWRLWALCGGAVSLVGATVEFDTERLLQFGVHLPVFAIVWIVAGELLQRWERVLRSSPRRFSAADTGVSVVGVVVLIAVGVFFGTSLIKGFGADLAAQQFTRSLLVDAGSLMRWVARDGLTLPIVAATIPALMLLGASVSLLKRVTALSPARRAALAFSIGPAVVTLAIAMIRLRWWNTFDAVFLVVIATAAAREPDVQKASARVWPWVVGTGAIVALGLLLMLPPKAAFRTNEYTPAEMQALMERDLAHWLAKRRSDAVVLAPPGLTTSLWFHGNLRGITTFDPNNRDGLFGALRIAGAPSQQEALTLLQARGVTHIVLPSWDRGLDDSARAAAGTAKMTFIEQLREWMVPPWLQPVAYFAPDVPGFEDKSVVVFEVVDPQSEPLLLSRMAAYFVETRMLSHVTQLRRFVERFPTDLSALVAVAEIDYAREAKPEFDRAIAAVKAALDNGADRGLAWDRRIALAVVLSRGQSNELAKVHIARCFKEADEPRLRSLSPRAIFRFLALGKNFGHAIEDARLRELSLSLLPPDSRERLR